MNTRTLPIIDVKGGPRERGRQQGEGARAQALNALTLYKEILPQEMDMTWEVGRREARKFLPYAEETFAWAVEELRGIAEGADVSFEDVWTLNCYEGLIYARQDVWGCTTLAVRSEHTASGHILMAHNEDWSSADRENVYLVRAQPDSAPSFIAMTYGPLLVNIGLNTYGIGVAINSIYPTDVRVGVPRVVFSRAVLNSRSIGEAIRACVPKLRAGGYNYVLADPNGELYSVETSATTHDILYGEDGWIAHTNHYLSLKMREIEQPGTYSSSTARYNRARRLLKEQLGEVTVESLQTLLRDHVNFPDSICLHEDLNDPPADRGMTLVSLVMDLTERVMLAAPNPPCESTYTAYRL
jgi:isopenicillin-N N-acyltransferase-like protein